MSVYTVQVCSKGISSGGCEPIFTNRGRHGSHSYLKGQGGTGGNGVTIVSEKHENVIFELNTHFVKNYSPLIQLLKLLHAHFLWETSTVFSLDVS